MKDSEKKDYNSTDETSLKEILSRKVSTLVGGLVVGGVALLLLLTILIIWLASK